MHLFWSLYAFFVSKEFRDWVLSKPNGDIGKLRTYLCRLRAHPDGIIYWYMGGLEPDYHCRNCNDDLG